MHANDLSTWLTYRSADPTGTLAAAQVPLAVDEIGENTWHRATGPSHLISGYDGTPTAFATGPRDHPRAIGQCVNFPTQ
ncbi:hypothetical protein [Streptomyces sp. NBC_01538]|uniref:hypothetical protein n=1 Tax=Streptomyces sp. NBC_01538 TaxID=2903897 RepID=UPI0038699531